MSNQLHECPNCGDLLAGPHCPECEIAAYPLWDVRDIRGRIVGQVAGATQSEALTSAGESIAYDHLLALTVTPTPLRGVTGQPS